MKYDSDDRYINKKKSLEESNLSHTYKAVLQEPTPCPYIVLKKSEIYI